MKRNTILIKSEKGQLYFHSKTHFELAHGVVPIDELPTPVDL